MSIFARAMLVTASLSISTQMAHANVGDKVVAAAQAQEESLGARVGVAVLDTGNGTTWAYRADERFPMASTFKALACGALLAAGAEKQAETTVIRQDEIITYSPVTEKMIGKEVGITDLCEATLRTSDNTAANKVLDALGGPREVTRFVASIGDNTTRLDRREPELNEGRPDDERDTTTPLAIASTMQKLVLGDALADQDREKLTHWLLSNQVGGPLVRAGIPSDWKIADRTGAGGFGTRGVVAVIWPPERKPFVVAIYLTGTEATMDQRNKAIAEISNVIASEISGN